MKDTREVIPMEKMGGLILSEISRNDSFSFTDRGKQKRVITWHPYPKERPEENTWYMVTVSERMDGSEPRDVAMMYYTKKGYFDDYSFGVTERTVVAWADKPEAYREVTASDTDSDIK